MCRRARSGRRKAKEQPEEPEVGGAFAAASSQFQIADDAPQSTEAGIGGTDWGAAFDESESGEDEEAADAAAAAAAALPPVNG